MRSFQAVCRLLPALLLSLFLYASQALAVDGASFIAAAFSSSTQVKPAGPEVPPAARSLKNPAHQADLFHEDQIDPHRMTAYGYDFFQKTSASNPRSRMRLRGGVSGLSAKAAAAVQMVVTW